jgi:hypothetical protein
LTDQEWLRGQGFVGKTMMTSDPPAVVVASPKCEICGEPDGLREYTPRNTHQDGALCFPVLCMLQNRDSTSRWAVMPPHSMAE